MVMFSEARESRWRACFRRGLPAVIVAVVVNGAMVMALAEMNRLAMPDSAPEPAASRPLQVHSSTPPREQLQEERQPEPEPEQPPEPITVDLDAPEPAAPAPAPIPLDLDLSMPAPGAVQVARRQAPGEATAEETAPASPASPASPAASGPMSAGQVDRQPRERHAPPPAYPRRALRRNREATVTMKLLIDEKGRVQEVKFLGGPPAFRDAVSKVIRQWRFDPAKVNGRPVPVWGRKEIRFSLEGRRG